MRRTLIVVEDRHAEPELRDALRRFAAGAATVITADALLAMVLERQGIEARLVTDAFVGPAIEEVDRAALAALASALGIDSTPPYADLLGPGLGPHLQYSLIPTFIRAFRNLTALQRLTTASPFDRIVAVGGGQLVRAAQLLRAQGRLEFEKIGASPWQLLKQTVARLRAGRQTRWAGQDFRALVLEPGFLIILYANGLWRRISRGRPHAVSPNSLIVTGDRWTANVVSRARKQARTVIVAGATQPGRALFNGDPGAVPIEAWTEPKDVVSGVVAFCTALLGAFSRVKVPATSDRFAVGEISVWPLVATVFRLHLVVWIPVLRHIQTLVRRVADRSNDATLLTSADATAYAGALVAAARQAGIPSTSIQHGLMGEPNGHSIVGTDVLAAWGPATEQWHRAHAPQHARFIVTGNPRFDTFPVPVCSRERPISRPFTVLVCTGFVAEFSACASDALNLRVIQATLDWAGSRNDVRVVHKLHPGEEMGYYATAAETLGWNHQSFTMTNEPILHDLLLSADLLVTGYSTTVVESIMLGTPVVVADFEQRPVLPVGRIPGVTVASSVAEFHERLDAAITGAIERPDPSHVELRNYLGTLDGGATDRVVEVVEAQSRRADSPCGPDEKSPADRATQN